MVNARCSPIPVRSAAVKATAPLLRCARRIAIHSTSLPSPEALFGYDNPFRADSYEPFRELRLAELKYEWQEPIGRVRQHVNPLSSEYQVPSESLQWEQVFKDPQLPLIVDAGSGYGRFPLVAAKNGSTKINYIGTEIRRTLIGRANFWAEQVGVADRVHFVFANITISLETLLKGYPGEVWGIFIQFPDPSFKRRKIKRHIVQPRFVEACDKVLHPGGLIFTQSDIQSCAIHMRDTFDRYGSHFLVPHVLHNYSANDEESISEQKLQWSHLQWLDLNPIGIPTEREVYSHEQGRPIYRTLLVKKVSD